VVFSAERFAPGEKGVSGLGSRKSLTKSVKRIVNNSYLFLFWGHKVQFSLIASLLSELFPGLLTATIP
jgi:hypothetical protein